MRGVAAFSLLMLLLATSAFNWWWPRPPADRKQQREPGDYNVILVSIDTLRADKLGTYGFRRWDISPAIDRLATRSVVFENAFANASITTGSHMSMFTGLSPLEHRVSNIVMRSPRTDPLPEYLSPGITTLPELMRRTGRRTARFVYARDFFLDESLGFGRGFDEFHPFGIDSLNSTFAVRQWLARNRTKPFFLFLHSKRPHSPYVFNQEILKGPAAGKALDPSYRGPVPSSEEEIAAQMQRQGYRTSIMPGILPDAGLFDDTPRPGVTDDKRRVAGLYELAVHLTDLYLGGVLEELEAQGLMDKTILVLVSDHGEQLLEHGAMSHQYLTYGETRVPFLLYLPPQLRARVKLSRIRADVQPSDILPTLLSLLGLPPLTYVSGKSLAPLLFGQVDRVHEEVLSVNSFTGIHRAATLRTERWAVQMDENGNRLYDRHADPKEERDIARLHPEALRRLELRIRELELRSYNFTRGEE